MKTRLEIQVAIKPSSRVDICGFGLVAIATGEKIIFQNNGKKIAMDEYITPR